MKVSNYLMYGALAITSAMLFQNCSPGDFSATKSSVTTASSLVSANSSLPASPSSGSANLASQNSSQSSSSVNIFASGNSLTTSTGKTLNFINLQGLSLGTASITNTQSSFTVSLLNVPSGRKASVRVFVDTSGNFIRVVGDSTKPYMCHDQNADICAQFPNATSGQLEGNCQSPIFYNGALSGSINSLTTAASNLCGSSSASASSSSNNSSANSSMCSILYSGGGSIQTPNQSQSACQSECQTNQNANPTETLTCSYNGQPLTVTSNVNVCSFTLSIGGGGSTANSTLQSCQAECRNNANLNPSLSLSCKFNNSAISF